MKDNIKFEIVRNICDCYVDVLMAGLEEETEKFPLTLCIIDFITKLREKNIVYKIDDIFISTFLDKVNIETDNYIGK